MTVVFNDDDLVKAFKQKQRIWYAYVGVLAFFLALCVACIVYYVSLPYEDPTAPVPLWIICVASCLFVIFSYIFLGIKFQRARKYYKIVSYLSVGMKQVNNSIFLRYEEPELKDSVDYYVLTMSEWSKKKSEYMDRKIYCDKEKPRPEFQGGDIVRYLTQGNIMVEYEVVGHDDEFVGEKRKEDENRPKIQF